MTLYETSPKTLRRHIEAIGKEKVIAALGGKKRLIKSLLVEMAPAQRQKLLAQLNGNAASTRQGSKSKAA